MELAVNGNILPGWQAGFAVSYVDSAWDDALVPGNNFDANGLPFVPVGQQIGYVRRNDKLSPVPRFSGNVTSEYRWTLGSYEPYVRGLYRYQGPNEVWGVVVNDPKLSGYGILDLFVGVSPNNGKWDVSLFAKNVTDQLGINYIGDPAVVNGWVSGYGTASLSPPREFQSAVDDAASQNLSRGENNPVRPGQPIGSGAAPWHGPPHGAEFDARQTTSAVAPSRSDAR